MGGRLLRPLFIFEWIPLGFLHISPSLEYLNHSCLLNAGLLPEIIALFASASAVSSLSSGLSLTTYAPCASTTSVFSSTTSVFAASSDPSRASFHALTVLGPTPEHALMTVLSFSSSLMASFSSATLLMPMPASSSTLLSLRPFRSVRFLTVILSPCGTSGRCRFRPGTFSCQSPAWRWPSRGWLRSGRRPRCRFPPR